MLLTESQNISYHSGNGLPLHELCEIDYHNEILNHLWQKLGAKFDKIHFHLLTHNGHEQLDFSFDLLSGNTPHVLFYFSDETGSIPYNLMDHFDLIFKAYFPYDRYDNIFPLPAGVNKRIPEQEIMPIHNRSYDLFFAGNLNWDRVALFDYVKGGSRQSKFTSKQKYYEFLREQLPVTFYSLPYFDQAFMQFNKGFNKGLSGKEYAAMLKQSKIVICPEGYFTHETYRHYEAMRAGCIVISKPLPDVYYWRDAPIIHVNDWQEMDDIIPELLSQPAYLEKLQAQMLDWWEKVLGPWAVAGYIYERIKSL